MGKPKILWTPIDPNMGKPQILRTPIDPNIGKPQILWTPDDPSPGLPIPTIWAATATAASQAKPSILVSPSVLEASYPQTDSSSQGILQNPPLFTLWTSNHRNTLKQNAPVLGGTPEALIKSSALQQSWSQAQDLYRQTEEWFEKNPWATKTAMGVGMGAATIFFPAAGWVATLTRLPVAGRLGAAAIATIAPNLAYADSKRDPQNLQLITASNTPRLHERVSFAGVFYTVDQWSRVEAVQELRVLNQMKPHLGYQPLMRSPGTSASDFAKYYFRQQNAARTRPIHSLFVDRISARDKARAGVGEKTRKFLIATGRQARDTLSKDLVCPQEHAEILKQASPQWKPN